MDKPALTPEQEAEQRLNAAFASIFSTPDGELCRQYLRRNWIELIKGSEATDAALRYHEGGRAVVATIETRIAAGKVKSHVRPGSAAATAPAASTAAAKRLTARGNPRRPVE